MAHTTVQEEHAVLFGSAKVEIAPYGTSDWTNIGAANGIKFSFKPKFITVEFDNTEVWKRMANSDEATISGTFFELSATNIDKVLQGITEKSQTTGAPGVTVTDEAVRMVGTKAYKLAHRMPLNAGAPVAVTITNCDSAAGAGGTAYTQATNAAAGDYVVTVDGDGYTYVARTGTSDIGDNTIAYFTYTYDTVTADVIDVGGITDMQFFKVKLTNTRESDSKDYIVLGHKATLDGDLGWTYGKDGDQKPLGCPFAFKLQKDTTLATKHQLFQITDQQSVVA